MIWSYFIPAAAAALVGIVVFGALATSAPAQGGRHVAPQGWHYIATGAGLRPSSGRLGPRATRLEDTPTVVLDLSGRYGWTPDEVATLPEWVEEVAIEHDGASAEWSPKEEVAEVGAGQLDPRGITPEEWLAEWDAAWRLERAVSLAVIVPDPETTEHERWARIGIALAKFGEGYAAATADWPTAQFELELLATAPGA